METLVKALLPVELLATMELLKAKDLLTSEIDELLPLVIQITQGYRINVPQFNPGLSLFRLRKMDWVPVNLSEITYPPPKDTRLNRANRANKPVFYCSVSKGAAYMECKPKVGDCIMESEWVTTKDLIVNHVGYTNQAFEKLKSDRQPKNWTTIPLVQFEGESDQIIHSFLAEAFTQLVAHDEHHVYKITAALAEEMIGIIFEGLAYPSIQARANSDNMALVPSFVDEHLKIKSITYLRIDAIDGEEYHYSTIANAPAYDSEGRIMWQSHSRI